MDSTDAGVGHPNVKGLVYIAAFAPDQGESGPAILGKYPGSRLAGADGPAVPGWAGRLRQPR